MNVLLIWPPTAGRILTDELSTCEPLPLEYVAAGIKEPHSAAILDLRLEQLDAPRYPAPDVVGISIPFTVSVNIARQVSWEVRARWPNAVIVLGGHHPSVSKRWMRGFAADFVVVGDGAAAMPALLSRLCDETESLPHNVLPYETFLCAHPQRDGALPVGAATSFGRELVPRRDLVAHNRSRYFHSFYRPVSLSRFSLGCPFRCNFCVLWKVTDGKYVTSDAETILADLSEIQNENVYVVDDEAFIDADRMLDLARQIKSAGIEKRFHMYCRADTARRRPDVIRAWAQVGLDSVLVGAESFSDADLVSYNKRCTSNDFSVALSVFHDAGVKVRANFIVAPEFRAQDFAALESQVKSHNVDVPSFSVLTPLPGTELFARSEPMLDVADPERFDCYQSILPTKLAPDDFYNRLADLMLKVSRTGDAGGPRAFYYSNSGAFDRMTDAIRKSGTLAAEV